jgi:hypothetical protein
VDVSVELPPTNPPLGQQRHHCQRLLLLHTKVQLAGLSFHISNEARVHL